MKTVKLVVLVIPLSLLGNKKVKAQNDFEKNTKISIELDPATFLFKGYSLHLRIQPKNSDHHLFGVGLYAMDLPDVFVNLNELNKNKGWKARINLGYGLFEEYYFSEVNRKWFVGGQLSIQEFQIENENYTGFEKFSNILVMPYIGYSFIPFKNRFYIKPWGGVGYTSKISGVNSIQGDTYDIAPLTMFLTVHLGYTF